MKYLKILKNWRIVALTIIAIAAALLIAGDGNRFYVIMSCKLIGLALALFGAKIGYEWHKNNLIDEINIFQINEDKE